MPKTVAFYIKLISTCFSLVACSFALLAKPVPEVEWLSSDFPPCHYHDGVNKGYCDEVGETLFAHVKGYRFRKNISSLARYKALMKAGRQFCTLELLYSEERSKYMHFSALVYPVLAMGIVSKKGSEISKRLSAMDPRQRMAYVVSNSIKIGVADSRFYGKYINDYLTRTKDTAYAAKDYNTLIELLKANKIHVSFFNPAELPIYDPEHQLEFFDVGNEPLILTYMSCTKSEIGYSIISQINGLLKTDGFNRLYEAYERRLRKEERKIYQHFLHQQCVKYDVMEPCPYE